jgi:hypothetical protein
VFRSSLSRVNTYLKPQRPDVPKFITGTLESSQATGNLKQHSINVPFSRLLHPPRNMLAATQRTNIWRGGGSPNLSQSVHPSISWQSTENWICRQWFLIHTSSRQFRNFQLGREGPCYSCLSGRLDAPTTLELLTLAAVVGLSGASRSNGCSASSSRQYQKKEDDGISYRVCHQVTNYNNLQIFARWATKRIIEHWYLGQIIWESRKEKCQLPREKVRGGSGVDVTSDPIISSRGIEFSFNKFIDSLFWRIRFKVSS